MDKVSLIRCADYADEAIEAALAGLLAPFGGMEGLVKPGQTVLLKLNLLMRRSPEKATTTHPAVVKALVKAVKAAGGQPILGDSPGGPFTPGMLRLVYEGTGIAQVARETGAQLNTNVQAVECPCPGGKTIQRVTLAQMVTQADVVFSVGKLKSHGLTTMTGAVKNLFGAVPGTVKVDYHARFPDRREFCSMLVDVCQTVDPAFAILDAVEAMEGEGPSGGTPRHIGALLGGINPHAVDMVGAQLLGLSEEQVFTLAVAKERGLVGEIDVQGEDPKALAVKDFQLPKHLEDGKGSALRLARLGRLMQPKPVFTHRQCNGCGVCARSCPAKAITMDKDQRPQVKLKGCIRCFCCQELCPQNDIIIKRHPVMALMR